MPAEGILAVTMPGFGTTGRTYNNAVQLIKLTGATFKEVDIKPACLQHFKDLDFDPAQRTNTYENVQARERTSILMNLANLKGGILVGTGDLSELALGWCTYNGDHMSMYNVNAGVPKTVIRLVLSHYASTCGDRRLAKAVRDVLKTPISPELLPTAGGEMTQLTEDLVGPYELHDFFLYYFLKFRFEPATLFRLALDTFGKQYSPETVKKWLGVFFRRFFQSQFKRSCMPDGPAVLGLSLSPRAGFTFPSDAAADLWLRQIEAL